MKFVTLMPPRGLESSFCVPACMRRSSTFGRSLTNDARNVSNVFRCCIKSRPRRCGKSLSPYRWSVAYALASFSIRLISLIWSYSSLCFLEVCCMPIMCRVFFDIVPWNPWFSVVRWSAPGCLHNHSHYVFTDIISFLSHVVIRRFFFSLYSRRTEGVESSRWSGRKSSIPAGILRFRVRISRARLTFIRFPFVFQLQDCLKSYGRGDENSYKKKKPPDSNKVSTVLCVLAIEETRPSVFLHRTFSLSQPDRRLWCRKL